MTAISICAATLAAGAPLVLADLAHPDLPTLRAAGLMVLVRSGDVLHPPGPVPALLRPLPPGVPLLAVVGDASLGVGLAVPVVGDAAALLPVLVTALAEGQRGATALRALGEPMTPVPGTALASAMVEGATPRLIAIGGEAPHLLLEVPAGGSADVALPGLAWPAAAGVLCDLACRGGPAENLRAALTMAAADGEVHRGAAIGADAGGRVRLLAAPGSFPGGTLGLWLEHGGAAPLTVEVVRLCLFGAPAAPATRAAPPAVEPAPRGVRSVVLPAAPPPESLRTSGVSVVLPQPSAPHGAPPEFRSTAPQPPLPVSAPPAPPPQGSSAGPRSGTAFQDLKLHQHLVNGDGSYRHLDVTLTGLVAAAGLWRQVRTKLFDRRGVLGLEFREMAGWPQMFDSWPGSARDNYGPFWRLESDATPETLAQLATAHDRALIAALAECLPALALRGALAADLPAPEQTGWTDRARKLATTISGAAGTLLPGG